mmetsp:Transcript_45248/g.106175  ORF Transcript_45248/g.106175 Transcript_45248/m.106175 type:complete len:260 (+) Transcript_45248:888-1667(+)
MLACSDEDDGRLRGSDCRERTSSLGVAVELRHDHRPHAHRVLERAGLVVRSLTDGGVEHEDHVVRLHRGSDLLHLLEERGLLLVAPGGVDDDDLLALLLEHVHAVLRDLDGVALGVGPVERDAGLGSVLLQLVKRAGAESVSADQARLEVLPVVVQRILGARGGFAAALESDEHDHVGLSLLGLVGRVAGVEHLAQLLEHRLLDHSPAVETSSEILKIDSALDVLPELGHKLNVDIGRQQRRCDLLEHVVDRLLIDDGV